MSDAETTYCPSCSSVVDDDNEMVGDTWACRSCYINEDCPAGCHEPHDVDHGGGFECPQTGEVYDDCHNCGWTLRGCWGSGNEGPDDRWYCESCCDEMTWCDDCGRCVWNDEARYDDYGSYCYSCWEDRHGAQPYRPRAGAYCMDLLRERFIDLDEARRLWEAGQPVLAYASHDDVLADRPYDFALEVVAA